MRLEELRWLVRFCYKKVIFSGINLSIFEHKVTLIISSVLSGINDSY